MKGELHPVYSQNPYNSSLMPVRFWEAPKETRGQFLPLVPFGTPNMLAGKQVDKVATILVDFFLIFFIW